MPAHRQATASCAVAFIARLVVPLAYLLLVGVLPAWRLELTPAGTVAWLFVSVVVLPAAAVVVVILRARRGRDRAR